MDRRDQSIEVVMDNDTASAFVPIPVGPHKSILPGTAQFLTHISNTPERKADPDFAKAIAACNTLRAGHTKDDTNPISFLLTKLTQKELGHLLCFMDEDRYRDII